MKTVTVLLLAICIVSSVIRADDAPNTCLERFGISVSSIPDLLRDRSEEGMRQRGCLEACALQKIGLMDGNTINLQTADEEIDKFFSDNDNKEEARQALHQCAAEAAGDDECMVAQKFSACNINYIKLRIRQFFNNQ